MRRAQRDRHKSARKTKQTQHESEIARSDNERARTTTVRTLTAAGG
jgi:hypothetical protein